MSLATVIRVFHESVREDPDFPAITYCERAGSLEVISRGLLYEQAGRVTRSFAEHGIQRGDCIVLALPTCCEFFPIYLAALYSGVVPLTVPSFHGRGDPGFYATSLAHQAERAKAVQILVEAEKRETLAPLVPRPLLAAEALLEAESLQLSPTARPDDTAHFQSTSGSTGQPKLAIIRHDNIVANVKAIGRAIAQGPGDKILSWLPFYHDMGMICLSCVLYWRRPLVVTKPSNFVRNPFLYWLKLIEETKATISPAPTSAYQVCNRLAQRRKIKDLDLSRWRVGFCGAEPVHAETVRQFRETFSAYGLSEQTLLPVYGLAEATLAVSIPAVGQGAFIKDFDMAALEQENWARPPAGGPIFSAVALGQILDGHQIRICDEQGHLLDEARVGRVFVRGPSIISGYLGSEEPVAVDAYLDTGDRGFLLDGNLYVIGRYKELVIINGRNLIPHEIEELVAKTLTEKLCRGVAAFGVVHSGAASESLHLVIETRRAPLANQAEIESTVYEVCSDVFSLTGVTIHWVGKGGIPRTTSGKIQRFLCRQHILEEKAV